MLPDASMLSVSMVPGSGTDASQEHKLVCLAGCHEHLPACLLCENRVLDGPASGEKGSKGRNKLDCQDLVLTKPVSWLQDLIAASIHDEYDFGVS